MALHLHFRPHANEKEPIERGLMACLRKLVAEAGLVERLIILGWLIDSRAFTIALPTDKFRAWSEQIKEVRAAKWVNYETIAQLLGRLNHVAFIIPAARHFTNRLRRLEFIANKKRRAKVNSEARKDLSLWLKLLAWANKGISINNVVYRTPTSKGLSDSSETGIGGYNWQTGIAWRYEFTQDEQVSFDINQKEYLASAINQKIGLEHDVSPHPCSNDITDNTSAAAWMYKSNFDTDSHPINNEIARWTAYNIIQRNASMYSQHLPGAANDIADSLSRDFHLSNEQLTSLYETARPPYYPLKQIKIIALPVEITSWIASLAQLRPKKRELKWRRTPSSLARGITGWSGSKKWGKEKLTPILDVAALKIKYASFADSYMQQESEISLPPGVKLKGRARKRPLITWLRPSLQVVGSTHV